MYLFKEGYHIVSLGVDYKSTIPIVSKVIFYFTNGESVEWLEFEDKFRIDEQCECEIIESPVYDGKCCNFWKFVNGRRLKGFDIEASEPLKDATISVNYSFTDKITM